MDLWKEPCVAYWNVTCQSSEEKRMFAKIGVVRGADVDADK